MGGKTGSASTDNGTFGEVILVSSVGHPHNINRIKNKGMGEKVSDHKTHKKNKFYDQEMFILVQVATHQTSHCSNGGFSQYKN